MTVEQQWQEDIHLRLLEGDPLAPEELCERLLDPVTCHVQRRSRNYFSLIDQSDVESAAIDALFEFTLRPQGFDPARISSLFAFLCMAAHRNIQNTIKSKTRRSKRETSLVPVEELEDAWNSIEDDSASEGLRMALMNENAEEWGEWILEVIPDAIDREVVSMMAEGERKTAIFAEILGVQDLPLEEQRMRVKQAKDRLVKRLRRAREKAPIAQNRKEER